MKPLTSEQAAFWRRYLAILPASRRPRRPFVEAGYAGDARTTDALIRRYLDGRKTAGSGLVRDFESNGEPLPKPGNYWIVLDGRGKPRLIAKTRKIVLVKFKDVTAKIAAAEGEGDLSVAHWKRVHRKFYAPFLSRWGVEDLDDARVVVEFFELVFSAPSAAAPTTATPARRRAPST